MRTKHLCILIHIRNKGEVFSNWPFLCGSFSRLSLSCCLVSSLQPCGQLLGKGWPLGSLVYDDGFLMFFFTFPYGVLGQVWYLIWSIPDLCLLPYFKMYLTINCQCWMVNRQDSDRTASYNQFGEQDLNRLVNLFQPQMVLAQGVRVLSFFFCYKGSALASNIPGILKNIWKFSIS